MSFILTEEQRMIRDLAREFAQKEIAPVADEMDKKGQMKLELIGKLAEIGFMGINVPEVYGGSGMDEVTKALVIMEIAKVDQFLLLCHKCEHLFQYWKFVLQCFFLHSASSLSLNCPLVPSAFSLFPKQYLSVWK